MAKKETKKQDMPHWLMRWWWIFLLIALIIAVFAVYFQENPLFSP